MNLIPTTSIAKLLSLRGRERLFHVIWGFTCWLALVLTLFTIAVIADWWIDKYRDTPDYVRIPMLFLQLIAASVAALFWIVYPWAKGPSLIRLAKRVEERIPEYDHRLITSIQLTRDDAQTEGMSKELIQNVAREAESISGKHDLKKLADSSRLKWSLALIAWPLALLAFLVLFFGPSLLMILFQRQFLAGTEIPRDISLKVVTKANPWPAGDPVVLRYQVTSKKARLTKELKGKVFVQVPGQPETAYDLELENPESFESGTAVFAAKVPHSSRNFKYRARIGDGRTKDSEIAEVTFEPRPIVTVQAAWVQMPDYVTGRPIEIQEKGDIKAINGSRAWVRILVQKPVNEAKLVLYKRGDDGASEVEVDSLDMKLLDPVTLDDGSVRYPAESPYFDLRLSAGVPQVVLYKVFAKDQYKFTNSDVPRRTIEIADPDLPSVKLVKDRFPEELNAIFNPDDEIEGLPVRLGGNIRIEYNARSPIGFRDPQKGIGDRLIAPARLVYRVNDEMDERYLPLDEIPESAESGPYDIAKASFANLDYQKNVLKQRVEFHAKPAKEEGGVGRIEGGGVFAFNTNEMKKKSSTGTDVPIEIGDHIFYRVEVYDRVPTPGRQPGRSEEFRKEIQTKEEVAKRAFEVVNSEQKIRDLEKRQQSIFARPKP